VILCRQPQDEGGALCYDLRTSLIERSTPQFLGNAGHWQNVQPAGTPHQHARAQEEYATEYARLQREGGKEELRCDNTIRLATRVA
jgi:hypothetical protein